jgi:glyoxylase-like metal-dependent hydrolase (beta-lactamase superfamily II)
MEKLKGGQRIKLGAKSWQAIDTPGHSPGHISLFEPESRTIVSGDLVGDIPAWHTPNSGGLDAYLKSLDKLESLEGEIILPSHGKPGLDAQASIRRIRTKLLERQETILDLLKNGPLSFARINRELFKTEPLQFFPGSVILESHLIKLELENRISRFFEDESGFGERIIVARA